MGAGLQPTKGPGDGSLGMGEDRRPFLNLTFSTWVAEPFIAAQVRKQCSADKKHRTTSRKRPI